MIIVFVCSLHFKSKEQTIQVHQPYPKALIHSHKASSLPLLFIIQLCSNYLLILVEVSCHLLVFLQVSTQQLHISSLVFFTSLVVIWHLVFILKLDVKEMALTLAWNLVPSLAIPQVSLGSFDSVSQVVIVLNVKVVLVFLNFVKDYLMDVLVKNDFLASKATLIF